MHLYDVDLIGASHSPPWLWSVLAPSGQDCVLDGVSSYVIDTEVVAYDRDTGNLLPFQVKRSVIVGVVLCRAPVASCYLLVV